MSYDDAPKLVAIDPRGCGCTECQTGEYKPIDQATEDDLRRLFLGDLHDNATVFWHISMTTYNEEDGFEVTGDGAYTFHLDTLELPIQAEHYTIELDQNVFAKIAGSFPTTLGKDS